MYKVTRNMAKGKVDACFFDFLRRVCMENKKDKFVRLGESRVNDAIKKTA